MKKISFNFSHLAALGALAMVAVGCSDDFGSADNVTPPVVSPDEPEPEFIEGVRVTATALAPVISRGHLVEGDDATTYVWDAITEAAEGGYQITTALVASSQGELLSWNKGDAFTTSNLTLGDDGAATLETLLPVCEDDIAESGEFLEAGNPYLYVMQRAGEIASVDGNKLRFKIENPFVGADAAASDGTLASLEAGMSVYATGAATESLSQSAADLGDVQFDMIPSIMVVKLNNSRSSQSVNIGEVKIAATKSNGTQAAAFASELYLDAAYSMSQKEFTFAFSEDSSTAYCAELSSTELAAASIEAGADASYYYMALPTDGLAQSSAEEWAALTARVTYTIEGSDDFVYLAKLKVTNGEAPFEAGVIEPSKFYTFEVEITDNDILAKDEVEELGETTVRSVCGELDSIMAAKFGDDYAENTLDYVEVLGEMTQSDLAALQNIKEVNIGEVMMIDGDFSNIIIRETFGHQTASKANVVLEKITLPKGITSIGDSVFENCKSLKEVVFPTEGIYVIANRCFRLSGIESLDIKKNCKQIGYATFESCKSLKSVEIEGLTNNVIAGNAFFGCSELTSVKLPSGIKIINANTFNNCSKLASFVIPSTVTSISDQAFANTAISKVEFPGAIASLGKGSYQNCKQLTSIDIPETITSISVAAPGTFSGCTALTTVKVHWLKTPPAISETFLPETFLTGGTNSILIPDGIDPLEVYNSNGWQVFNKHQETPYDNPAYVKTEAGGLEEALKAKYGVDYKDTTIDFETVTISGVMNAADFEAVQNITSLNLSLVAIESVEYIEGSSAINSIPMYAFGAEDAAEANNVLEEITLPSAMTNIGYGAFMNCLSLSKIVLPTTTKYVVRNFALSNTGVEEFVFGENLSSLAYKAMFGSTKTKKVTFEGAATQLAGESLSNCAVLESVVLPAEISTLENKLFSACPELSKVSYFGTANTADFVLPTTLTTISNGVFFNCKKLNNVVIPASVTTLTSAIPGAFDGCDALTSVELKWSFNVPVMPENFLPASFKIGGANKILVPDGIDASSVYAGGWEAYNLYQNNAVVDERVVVSEYAGGLAEAMAAKFGADYAATTIDEIIVKGTITAVDFEALQNIKIVDLSKVAIVDIDHDKNASTANVDNALPPFAFNQSQLLAFGEGNTVLERVVLPEVTSIGFCAFGGCTALTDMENLVLPKTAYFALQNRALDLMYLTELNVPANATGLSYRGFGNNAKLETVTIGNINTAGLPNEVFFGCNNITSFEVVWGGEGMNKVPAITGTNKPLPAIFYAGEGSQYVKIPDGEGVYEAYVAAGWGVYNLYNAENPKK